MPKPPPLTLGEVQRRFRAKGLELLESAYINQRSPMRYRCPCGRVGFCSVTSLSHKHGPCRQCVHDTRRFSLRQVQQMFAEQGCRLLAEQYWNKYHPIEFICKCGRRSHTTLQQFGRGSRCPDCSSRRKSGERNLGA